MTELRKTNVLNILPYDPGVLPTLPAPIAGDRISFRVEGLPPHKDGSHSIRNIAHPRHESFVALRSAAIAMMKGRAWYFGPIKLDLTIHAPGLNPKVALVDYLGGVMDTLDGSSGPSFTYLPIVYEDDCQVCSETNKFEKSDNEFYEIEIEFMHDGAHDP